MEIVWVITQMVLGLAFVIGLFLLFAGIYFLPAIVAYKWRNHHFNSIIILNIFLGWTFVGWVIALVWAVMSPNTFILDTDHKRQKNK